MNTVLIVILAMIYSFGVDFFYRSHEIMKMYGQKTTLYDIICILLWPIMIVIDPIITSLKKL